MDLLNRKKTELHCHLDGSLPKQWMEKTVQQKLPEEKISVSMNCSSLTEYLEKFDLPLSCLQEEKRLEEAAYAFAGQAAAEQTEAIEVRFAPALHRTEGLSLEQIIRAVDRGMELAKRTCSIDYGIIVCAMRHHSPEVNQEMLEEAARLREEKAARIAALDLAGDETAFPTRLFRDLFQRAR